MSQSNQEMQRREIKGCKLYGLQALAFFFFCAIHNSEKKILRTHSSEEIHTKGYFLHFLRILRGKYKFYTTPFSFIFQVDDCRRRELSQIVENCRNTVHHWMAYCGALLSFCKIL